MDQMWTVREEESRMIPRFVWPGQQDGGTSCQDGRNCRSRSTWDMMNIQEGYNLGGKLLDMEF